MQKAKNAAKYRPVIMCGGHPLRKPLNMAGRAELFLLSSILAGNPASMVLWSTQDLTKRLVEWSAQLDE